MSKLSLSSHSRVLAETILRGHKHGAKPRILEDAGDEPGMSSDNRFFLPLKDGLRVLRMSNDTERDEEALLEQFKMAPIQCQALCRINIMSLLLDGNIADKEEIIEEFIDALIELVIETDKTNFPVTDDIYQFIPEYIPEGLSDMGKDASTGNRVDRKRIRINKAALYEQHRSLIKRIFMDQTLSKDNIVELTAKYIRGLGKYDTDLDRKNLDPNGSVELHAINVSELRVCRTDAHNFQVLMQLFGIECRIIKCTLGKEQHGVNIFRKNGKWYLIDVTNPIDSDGRVEFIMSLKNKGNAITEIDLNKTRYTWQFTFADIMRQYKTHNRMRFRMRDNSIPIGSDEELTIGFERGTFPAYSDPEACLGEPANDPDMTETVVVDLVKLGITTQGR